MPHRKHRQAPVGALLLAVASALFSGCGARFDPRGPGPDPADPVTQAAVENSPSTRPSDGQAPGARPPSVPAKVRRPHTRDILIGEMCPGGANGRAAVIPLFLRATTWSIDGDEVSLPIERRTARNFSVLSWQGRRAGVFSVAGAAEVGLDRRVAIGAYAGESPCAVVDDPERASADSAPPVIEPACVRAQNECGLAIAAVDDNASRPYEEDPEPLIVPTGGGCVAGDRLLVDIDGDGIREAYLANSFLDLSRAPAEEVLAVSTDGRQCTPRFAASPVLIGTNPKHFGGLDLVGVLDIDSDGRNELIVAYHYAERRTWAVYTAAGTVARLDLVGETIPWPSP